MSVSGPMPRAGSELAPALCLGLGLAVAAFGLERLLESLPANLFRGSLLFIPIYLAAGFAVGHVILGAFGSHGWRDHGPLLLVLRKLAVLTVVGAIFSPTAALSFALLLTGLGMACAIQVKVAQTIRAGLNPPKGGSG